MARCSVKSSYPTLAKKDIFYLQSQNPGTEIREGLSGRNHRIYHATRVFEVNKTKYKFLNKFL